MLDYLRIMLDARLAKLSERGASAVEYGLLIAGMGVVIFVSAPALGDALHLVFTHQNAALSSSPGNN
jgi:pilus assembly protein Flp/PilA